MMRMASRKEEVTPVALACAAKRLAALLSLALACGPAPTEVEGSAASSSTTAGTTWPVSMPSTADTSSDGADEGTVFLYYPDGGGVSFECSTFEQDCPAYQKCMPWANDGGGVWNATKCVPIVDDPNALGEPCTVVGSGTSGEDDCDGTSMCWDIDPETDIGTCVAFCGGSEAEPTCPNPCDRCAISESPVVLCFSPCDPLLPSCEPGEACIPINEVPWCVSEIAPEGTGIGDPCPARNGCPPGMACQAGDTVPGCAAGSDCCAPYCPLGGADPCPELLPGSTCTPIFDGWPQPGCGGEPTGLCLQ